MIGVNTSLFSKQIDNHGELVKIEVITDEEFNDYGDISNLTSEYQNVPTIFNTYGRSAIFRTEGVFLEGDVSFFFKGTQSGVSNRNVIVRSNGERWRIEKVYPQYYRGVCLVQEARVSNT